MFVANYRLDNDSTIMAGGDAVPCPYPKLSAEDWRVWQYFLPVRALVLDRREAENLPDRYFLHDIPEDVASEIKRAAPLFDTVEVWRKHEVSKDPIAVGVLREERYLIARWGREKLIPFERVKQSMALARVWKYGVGPVGGALAFSLAMGGWIWLVSLFQ